MKTLCPDEEALADYILGRVADDDKSGLESHLSDCELCLEEFMTAKSLLQADEVSEFAPVPDRVTDHAVALITGEGLSHVDSVKEKIVQSVKNLNVWLSDHMTLKSFLKHRFAVVRGTLKTKSEDLFHVRKIFKEIDTEIEIEKTDKDRAIIRVSLVNDIKEKRDVRVSLVNQGEREISSCLLNGGFVVFEDIQFGRYHLVFKRNGRKLGTYRFEIKETRHGRK